MPSRFSRSSTRCLPSSSSTDVPAHLTRAARRPSPGSASRSPRRTSASGRGCGPRWPAGRSIDGRLLFGGREVYTADNPKDIAIHIRRQIAEIYPSLKDVEITHAWGGYVGITMPRKPFIREVMPNVISAGGYSGHGVMLSNFVGKLYAETVSGTRDRLKLFEDLRIPPFPGGRRFRAPLLFLALNWYALRDRI